ncbi:BspA family leucine-rich repeat surface protein [Polaribacter septentrionalilitoris]|uniref:BspA family leucine-rich repeat surface protein n=1 Tax=Polaribacter septentrionalilitoris TaxID=2494657 RepID=UPI0013593319|nr:BspA family leucine-rich repeat surface protein [Polaribacter septentrionalilitoris]
MKKRLLSLIFTFYILLSFGQNEFITKWKLQFGFYIDIPVDANLTYNYTIDWGDGNIETNVTGDAEHFYDNTGEYIIKISGVYPRFVLGEKGSSSDKRNIIELVQWGNNTWVSMESAFKGLYNMKITATDTPNLLNVTTFRDMFYGCSAITTIPNINSWNTSNITNMWSMFQNASNFNSDISNWDVSNVTQTRYMFDYATKFNQNISSWNVSKVETMQEMFDQARSFNQDLSSWNITNVSSMSNIFNGTNLSTENYDRIIAGWSNLPTLKNNVTFGGNNINYCHSETERNKLINDYNWTIYDAGKDCTEGFITKWDIKNDNEFLALSTSGNGYDYRVDWGDGSVSNHVTSGIAHNYAISGIYTIKITGVFPRFSIFDTSSKNKIIDVVQWGDNPWESISFEDCPNLNITATDIPDLSNVTSTEAMFKGCVNFEGNLINNWNVSNIISMQSMFEGATKFNQTLNKWDVGSVINMTSMFDDSGLSIENYDAILLVWSGLASLQQNVNLGALSKQYCNGETGRTKLINDFNWTFSDAGKDCSSFNPFITKWETTAANESLFIPVTVGSNSFTIDWGDGEIQYFGGYNRYNIKHTYTTIGNHTIKITGNITGLNFATESVASNTGKILEIIQWGNINWSNMSFSGCYKMDITATDIPDLSNLTSLNVAFRSCRALIWNSTVNNWDVSSITDMQSTFDRASIFNQDLNNWNVSNVTNMKSMFQFATKFNGNVTNWNVSNVKNIQWMFASTQDFNQDIGSWNVSSISEVDGFSGVFQYAKAFNQDISSWDLSSFTGRIVGMFDGAISFNQDISSWDTSNITGFSSMFRNATNFNQDISSWNLSKATDLGEIFSGATNFNKDLSNWDTSNVTFMGSAFKNATAFNQNINSWELSKVTNTRSMFEGAISFNQDISGWNVSVLNSMQAMFKGATSFNQDLSSWDTVNTFNMQEVFQNATSYNQDLSNWNVGKVYTMLSMFDNSGISVVNYDKTLKSWSVLSTLKSNINLGALGINYCNSETARNKLINDYNWNFSGDSKDCSSINTSTNTNGMWNDPANWSSGVVPTTTDNVVIPSGTTLQISADISEVNSLENEGTIVISPTYSLKSKSNLVNTGTIVMDSGIDDSSVLFIEGTSSGNVTYTRGGLKANKWSLVTPPVSGQKIKGFATDTNNDIRVNTTVNPNRYAIGYYSDAATEGDKWVYYTANVDENLTFIAGQSYALSRATDGSVSFTGTLTTNNLTRTLQPGEWNAIGNPFTTYYPANKNGASSFINDNYDILDDNYKGIYVWDNSQNKYIAVSEADIQNRALTPGQGFFIKLKAGENEIAFKQDKRSVKPNTGNNVFNKNDNSYIQLFVSNGEYKVATNINFLDNATSGFDVGLDIGNFSSSSFDFYTKLVDKSNNKNYTTQSLAKENKDDIIIPLELKIKNNEVTFSSKSINLKENVKLYLEDKVKNTFTDITQETNGYKISFNETNIIKERFYLHVKSEVLNLDNSLINQIQVFSSNKTLHIRGIKDLIKVEVFDLLGKNVYTKSFKNINTIDMPLSVSDGVYVVKVTVDNKSLVKKIVLR